MASTAGVADTPQKVLLESRTSPQSTTLLIEFEATIREVHTSRVQVTDHPVEDGSSVTDHSRLLPKRLQLDIVISDHPIIVNAADVVVPDRAKRGFATLEDIQEKGEILTVRTSLRDYDNMILEEFTAPRDAATGNVLSASLSLRELITATTETVEPPAPTETTKAPETDQGRRNTTEASPETETKSSSVLNDWSS
jgi:hypothetical protein